MLARAAFRVAAEEGMVVYPSCSYISRFVEKNPEYRSALALTATPTGSALTQRRSTLTKDVKPALVALCARHGISGAGLKQALVERVVAHEFREQRALNKPLAGASSEGSTELFDATQCAEQLLHAWVNATPLSTRNKDFSPPDLSSVYAVHAAMVCSGLAAKLGGHAGYKQGGIGAALEADGAPAAAVYGPLFNKFVLPEGSATSLSQSRLNLFGIEAEIGFR